LRRWARDLQNKCENEDILIYLGDVLFWNNVDELLEIFKPFHEAQIMSESSKSNLSYVYSRWNKVKNYLTTQHALIRTDLLSVYEERFEKQISEIHLMAFYLNPVNQAAQFENPGDLNKCTTFLKDYFEYDDYIAARISFLHYKGRRNEYSSETLWEKEYIASFIDFWDCAAIAGPELAVFAQRLLFTSPNSFLCERSFSCMKLH
jgi:hypothetical protein